jgi:hypothetical protein
MTSTRSPSLRTKTTSPPLSFPISPRRCTEARRHTTSSEPRTTCRAWRSPASRGLSSF